MARSKTTVKKLDDEDVVLTALAFNTLDKQAKDYAKQAQEKKDQLKDYLMENGTVGGDNHIRIQLKHAGNLVTLTNQARVMQPALLPEALEIVKATRFKDQLVETYEGVNLDKVEKLHKNGKLSDTFVASLFGEEKTSYAFNMKVEKDDET